MTWRQRLVLSCGLIGGLCVALPPAFLLLYIGSLVVGIPYFGKLFSFAIAGVMLWYGIAGFPGVLAASSFWIMHKIDRSVVPPWEHSEDQSDNP